MRVFSKFTGILISMVMVLSCAGCSIFAQKENAASDYDAYDENSITCMVWDRGNFPEGYSADDNALANWIKAKVKDEIGITLHFVSVDRSTSDSTLKKMVDEGTAPDIFFTYSSSVFGYMTTQGKVADLTESVAEYGKNIKEYIGDIQYMGVSNDLQIAVMERRGFKAPRHMAYIRKDWCEKLGLRVPATKRELINYLYAIKENNPGGVKGAVPWAMGGDIHSERFYQDFVSSYVDNLSERDAYIYNERYMVVADGAIDGLRELNRLYNDGIISLDFTADKDDAIYTDVVTEGKAGFFVDDATSPFTYISELKQKEPSAQVEPVLCFDLDDGTYRNVAEPDYGLYVMVPASSKNKIDAVVKYLNWLADPKIAEMVYYTPDHQKSSSGAAMAMSREELFSMGYPGNPDDYCIVNQHFDFVDDKNAQVSTWTQNCKWETEEWFEHFYDMCLEGQFTYPSTNRVLDSEAKYQVELDVALVEYAYNLICCPSAKFDEMQKEEYERLVSLGLLEVLQERGELFDSGYVKVNKD